jgi:phospholipid/cholesterol/gamma-HCH transport system substrate-binding protein
MSEQRLAFKVGLFVFIGLTLLAGLMLYFSKGESLFKPGYTVYLKTSNVGGLKTQAKVLMSGVEIGTVKEISLSEDGRIATITLRLLERFVVHKDAEFTIDSQGLLGDQFIAVTPKKNEAGPLKNGDMVECKEPFNLQELLRGALGVVNQLKQTMAVLHGAIERVDQTVLNAETLGNLKTTISNLVVISDKAIVTVGDLGDLVKTNSAPFGVAVSNLVLFSEKLNTVATNLDNIVVTNGPTITEALDNIKDASASLKDVMADVHAGRGLVGSLLAEEGEIKGDVTVLVTNLNTTVSNLSLFTSNLNSRGLWSVLWKPKPPKKSDALKK